MENSNNSVFSKLMSIVFIAMGIFLGIYAFFANATNREYGLLQNESWVISITGDNVTTYGDITTDIDNDIYVGGIFSSEIFFGSTTLTSRGVSDAFVAKMDENKTPLWIQQMGGSGSDDIYGTTIDSSGNTYVIGTFSETGVFGSTQLISSGSSDIFIAKLDNNGNRLRAKKAGGLGSDIGNTIVIDPSGNLYVGGYFYETGYFGSTQLVNSGSADIFIAKLDNNGNRLRTQKAGGTNLDKGNEITVDTFGNIYSIGFFYGTGYFGSTQLVSSGNNDVFVAKLDSDGNRLWAQKAGGTASDQGYDITSDLSGNIYTIGVFTQTGYFDAIQLPNSGSTDIFIAKLDSDGNRLRAQKAGGTASDQGYGITLDSSGNIYAIGLFAQTGYFGSTQLVSSGLSDIFIAKLDSNGNRLYSKQAGGTNNDYGYGVTMDVSGSIYTLGYFSQTGYFGSSMLSGGNNNSVFISKFVFDETIPTYTGITQAGTIVISGGLYNTGITITFFDLQLSGATLDGNQYTGNTLITGEGIHHFFVQDLADNAISTIFTIDTSSPSMTGTTQDSVIISSGGYYTTSAMITFYDDNLSGARLNGISYQSGDAITGDGLYVFLVQDLVDNSTGMIFTIDTTKPTITGNYPTQGLTITTGSTVTFRWSGYDALGISGYILHISGTTAYDIATSGTTYTQTVVNSIYTWYVEIVDKAGNTGTSAPLTFTINTPLLPTMTLLTGNLKYTGGNRYTKDYASIRLWTNKSADYTFTGDFYNPEPPFIGTGLNGTLTVNVNLTGTDGQKKIYLNVTDGINNTGMIFTVYLDTIAPIPTLTSPISGSTISGVTVTLTRGAVGADPSGAGLSGYQYFVANNSGTTVTSGFTTSTSAIVSNLGIGTLGIFSWYVRAIDNVGNYGTSAIRSFIYSGIADIIPNSFSFNDVTNADLNEIYASNTVTITGMTANTPVLASINRGALYISGNMIGTTGYIQNGRTVKIELTSSNEYDDEVSSTLTIGGISDIFKVTTKEGNHDTADDYDHIETDLSNTEKLMVIAIFETLKDVYAGDKEEEFFNTMMLMLEEQMDEYDDTDDEYIALKYLYDVIEMYYDEGNFEGDDIDIMDWITDGIYTAPNGKKYTITYDSTTQRFTSTNFVVPKYFPTLDTLKYIIDINNPAGSQYANAKPILARWKNARIDGTWQTSPYTAPNRKAFYFFKDIYGKYSSYTFTTERYFDTLNDVKEFIYNSNR